MTELKRSLAVVIGINQYVNGIPMLKTAVNDAAQLATNLKETYQYQVLQLLDTQATYTQLTGLFTAFQSQAIPLLDGTSISIQPDDRVFFYFAGHGIAVDGIDNADGPAGFLVPQDAQLEDQNSWIPMQQLHDALVKLPCRHLLVVLDCCFAGSFRWAGHSRHAVRSQKVYRERYDRFVSGFAQQVITSAAHDEKAADSLFRFGQRGEGEDHSPFAELLLKALSGSADFTNDGVITATELYLYLHSELGKTVAKQTPGICQLKRHDKGEYIFPIPGFNRDKLVEAPKLDEKLNPYRGLESFDEEHSALFFGRKALISKLQEFVSTHSLTVVLGASGSGKSSLVKAGLITQLRNSQEKWRIFTPMRPGNLPFSALNNTLAEEELPGFSFVSQSEPEETPKKFTLSRIPRDLLATRRLRKRKGLVNARSQTSSPQPNIQDADQLDDSYEQELKKLNESVSIWSQLNPDTKMLLVIDQCEELITLCENDQDQRRFLAVLARSIAAYPNQLRIVLTLRSDFEPQFRNTALEAYWRAARFVVPGMTREELRQVIEEPATARVMYFEPPNLVDQLIDEVSQMPGALPLLSFTLSELYFKYIKSCQEGKRNNRAITQEDYEELGGVTRSLTQRADCEYEQLVKRDSAYANTIRHVMLRMVAVGGGELARRRVLLSELIYPKLEHERVEEVINSFSAARLLVGGQDTEGNLYVEPAHDVLVRGWQRLLNWKKQEQESLILQRRLTPAAEYWKSGEQKPSLRSIRRKAKGIPLGFLLFVYGLNSLIDLMGHLPLMGHWLRANSGLLWYADPRLPLLHQVLKSTNNWFNQLEAEFVQRSIQHRRENRYLRYFVFMVVLMLIGGAAFDQWKQNKEAKIISLAHSSEVLQDSNHQLEALLQGLTAYKQNKQLEGWLNWLKWTPLRWTSWSETKTTLPVTTALQQVVYGMKESNRLQGHTDSVNTVRFSPDGKMLASGSGDNTIKLWQRNGQLIRTLTGHTNVINSVSFSPNGKLLASASDDKTIKLWNVENGRQLRTFVGHKDVVNRISFSADGKLLTSASADKTIKLWSLNGKVIKTLKGHKDIVYTANFSRDGKLLASVSSDKTIKLWSLPQGTLYRTIRGHTASVYGVNFSPDSKMLASASSDNTVKLWNLEGKEIRTLRGHRDTVNTVFFAPNSKILASASEDSSIKLWSVSTGNEIGTLRGHSASVYSVHFSSDSKTLASASWDNTVRLWNLDNQELKTLKGHTASVNSINFSLNGQLLASGSSDNTIKLWGLNGREIRTLSGHGDSINSIHFSRDGKRLASASSDNTIKLWSLKGELLKTFRGHKDIVNSVHFSPDGKMLASASWDNTIKLWNLDGKLLNTLIGHKDTVYSVRFSADSKLLASGSWDKTIKIWRVADGKKLRTLQGHEAAVYGINFSPDSKLLASASRDKTIKVWNLQGSQKPQTFYGHNDTVISVSFSPDGKMLASASADKTIKLWNLKGEEIAALKGHEDSINNVTFSPDGKMLASASRDETALVWNLDLLNMNHLLRQGCSWLRDYLETNSTFRQKNQDRQVCDGIEFDVPPADQSTISPSP